MDIFGKVAVASTFSPRFLPMLAEAKAVAALLDRPLEIIHAGTNNPENRERFSDAFAEMDFSGPIHWRQAPHPSTAIIQAVRDAGIGLLVAGAMERDSEGRFSWEKSRASWCGKLPARSSSWPIPAATRPRCAISP